MTYDRLLWVFGMILIAASCNAPTWWWLTYQAARDKLARQFFYARLAIALLNLNVLLAIWARASQAASHQKGRVSPTDLIVGVDRSLHYIFWSNHPAFVIPTASVVLLAGEVLMLMASGVALKRVGKRAMGLRVFLMFGLLWTVVHGATPL
jgi:hypothetical protein